MFKKILMPLVILGMVFFVQCTDDPILPDTHTAKGGNGGGGGGGGGNGNGNGGGNGGNGGSGGLYGDLVLCLRTADGIPDYDWAMGMMDEMGPVPKPIMINADGQPEPYLDYDPNLPYNTKPDIDQGEVYNAPYLVFQYDELGEIIPVEGYVTKEVVFGRLNFVRAPQAVLDAALQEAITGLDPGGQTTAITTDASGRLVAIKNACDWIVNFDEDETNDEFDDKTVDAPRENVAIYQELLSHGLTGELSFFMDYGYTNADIFRLAYGAIAAGADKTGSMNVDEFGYMNDWLIKWGTAYINDNGFEEINSPDEKERHYYNYNGFTYDRYATYSASPGKVVEITTLNQDGTWTSSKVTLYQALTDRGLWTDPLDLVDYEEGANINLTGFSNAADDAIQVLEFIHSSDLIVYNPYFIAD
jgi:hypothetical protein